MSNEEFMAHSKVQSQQGKTMYGTSQCYFSLIKASTQRIA